MKVEEFKAWFEGYTEDMNGTPSVTQWEKIKKRVSEIDGTSVNTVYVDRWYSRYPWVTYPYYDAKPLTAYSSSLNGADSNMMNNEMDTCSLMYNIGKTDFLSEQDEKER